MKNDHRIAVTKKMIADAFLIQLKAKPVGEITVKELCEAAHINRATFYSHYENIISLYDSLRSEFTGHIIKAVTDFSNEDSLKDMTACVCRCIAENSEYCETVFGKYADPDFINTIVELIRMKYIHLWQECGASDETEMNMTFTFLAYGGIAVLRSWIQGGMKESPEHIASFIEKNVKIKGFDNQIRTTGV